MAETIVVTRYTVFIFWYFFSFFYAVHAAIADPKKE